MNRRARKESSFTRGLRLACAAAAIACCGCDLGLGDDPWKDIGSDPCLPGNARDGQAAACTVPFIDISLDGATDDWRGIAALKSEVQCDGDCPPTLPVTVQFAQYGFDQDRRAFAFHVQLPEDAVTHATETREYVLEFHALPERPSPTVHALVVTPTSARYRIGGGFVRPFFPDQQSWVVTWTADGFEGAVDEALLPFEGGVGVALFQVDATTDEVSPAATTLHRACFDGDDLKIDPCRSEGGS